MRKTLNILAIVILAVTVIGAATVLYGMNALEPQVISAVSTVTPAANAQAAFDQALSDAARGVFAGEVFADPLALKAGDCWFVTYTVRLKNRGFFPAEWIALKVQPVSSEAGQDILVLENAGANVLPAGTEGDMAVTLLTTISDPQPNRTLELTCYVFGRKQTVYIQVQ